MKTDRKTTPLFYMLTILALIRIGWMPASAQQDIAQEAYLIFQQNCLNCHGEHGAFTRRPYH